MSARTILKHVYENGGMTEYQYERIDRVLKERERPHGECDFLDIGSAGYGETRKCECTACGLPFSKYTDESFYFCPKCGAERKGNGVDGEWC